jgi:hypothetical protein
MLSESQQAGSLLYINHSSKKVQWAGSLLYIYVRFSRGRVTQEIDLTIQSGLA